MIASDQIALCLSSLATSLRRSLPTLKPALALQIVGLTTAVALGFSLAPVIKAARLNLDQALRYY